MSTRLTLGLLYGQRFMRAQPAVIGRSSLAAARHYSQLPRATVGGPSTGPQGAQAASPTNPMSSAPTPMPEMAEPARLDTNLPPPAEVVTPSEPIVVAVPPQGAHPMATALPAVKPDFVEPTPAPVVIPPPSKTAEAPYEPNTSSVVDTLNDKLPPAAELAAKMPTPPSAAELRSKVPSADELKAQLPSAEELKAKLPTPPSAAEIAAKIPDQTPKVETAPVIPPPPPPPRSPWFPKTRRAVRTLVYLAIGGIGYTYYSDSSAAAHSVIVMPLLRALTDAEDSHKLAIQVLQWPLRPVDKGVDDPVLETDFFGHKLASPLGLAAGFDKNAEAVDGLFDLGFSYVEIGSVTPAPQPGNPKPRFFRLTEDQSCINRYGFNSDGHAEVLQNLRKRLYTFYHRYPALYKPAGAGESAHPVPPAGLPRSLIPGKLLGVNLGKNKSSDAASDEDYIRGVKTFGQYADVLVINVSSPNTPGLRNLQGGTRLGELLKGVVDERDRLKTVDGILPKLLVKVAPDLDSEELRDIAKAVKISGIDGVIVSNTTISRPATLKSPNKREVGGLSGPPAKPLAIKALRALRAELPASVPLIGCGGITTGEDALDFAAAGASAVQLYTSFGFRGVGAPRFVKDELAEALKARGTSWKAVAGGKALPALLNGEKR